jgi:nitrogen-specific signal transduction histidine kinase
VGSGTAFSDSDDRVAAVIDSLDEPALLLDDGDSVIHLNQEAAEALAVDRGQIIGKTLADDGEYRGASCARVLAALERAKTFPADEHQIDLNVRGRECIYFLKRPGHYDRRGSSGAQYASYVAGAGGRTAAARKRKTK